MRALPVLAPSIDEAFREGQFTVHQCSGQYNVVRTDMALEKTYNRDAKMKLFAAITQKPATIDKYLRAHPILTAISEETKAMANLNTCLLYTSDAADE